MAEITRGQRGILAHIRQSLMRDATPDTVNPRFRVAKILAVVRSPGMSLDMNTDAGLIGINSSMELEHVYWHFWTKFQQLSVPRSVAEARVTTEEVRLLGEWFAGQYGRPRNWCDRTWQEKVEGDHSASSREMFGALFLILASELGRDLCSEESLWPIIAERFETNKATHSVLFANQHPTELLQSSHGCRSEEASAAEFDRPHGKTRVFRYD